MAGIYLYGDNQDLYLQALTLAKKLSFEAGEPVCALALHGREDGFNYGEVNELIVLESADAMPENYAKAVAELLDEADPMTVVMTSTATGRDLAAQVAALRDLPLASEVQSATCVDGTLEVSRMMFGGAVVSDECLPRGSVVTLGVGRYDAAPEGEPVSVRTEPVQTSEALVQVSLETAKSGGTDIATAERVVGVGRGIGDEQCFAAAQEMATALGAELGCTRSIAEEFKWLPNESYIGISGMTVNPDLYLALGISGQVQHMVGVRGAKVIVAVNTNEKAPVFQSADYGIVGDVSDVMAALMKAL